MTSWHSWREKALEAIGDLGLLGLRLWVGQEFLLAGWNKVSAGTPAPEWFAGLNFPWPQSLLSADVNWTLAGFGEMGLALALLVGLFSRLAALGLIYVTFVAVWTVHFDLGWSGWNQIDSDDGLGFKVPLMLALMLWTLVTQGPGRYALDAWHTRRT